MELTFNAENLSKPWFRALIGIIFIIAGFFCVTSENDHSSITRESCVEGEAILYELRFDSIKGGTKRGARLIFDDYDMTLNIHSSCDTNELSDALYKVKKGTRMKFIHNSKSGVIYELWVEGEQLLDFDTAKKKISENVDIVILAGYILLPAGALFIISVPIVELIKKEKQISK